MCSFVVSCARGRLRRFGATFRGKKKAFAREYTEKITAEFKAALDDRQSSGATSANGTGSGGGDDDSEGEAALAARRHVASKLTDSGIAALQRARRIDKPNWSLMQQLYDAGFKYDPITSMPVHDPSKCSPKLLTALWRAYCGVADTINTNELGQTDEALEELKTRLLEHAARITENAPRSKRLSQGDGGVLAKRPRSSSPASSRSDEGTDTGEQAKRRKRPSMSDDSDADEREAERDHVV